MVSFTGSVDTGSAVTRAAAHNVTKVNLELGGKEPAVVMVDAELELSVQAIKSSRLINSGQVCNCVERVDIQRKIAEEFVDRLSTSISKTRFGDPVQDKSGEYGPLINQNRFQKVDGLVKGAVKAGATLVTGGRRGPSKGG